MFVQSRNPDVCFWHPTSRAYFQSQISPPLCFKISNPGFQKREILHLENPIENIEVPKDTESLISCSLCIWVEANEGRFIDKLIKTYVFDWWLRFRNWNTMLSGKWWRLEQNCALLVSKNINKDKVTRVVLDKTINGSATGHHMSWLVNISTPLCLRKNGSRIKFYKTHR